MVTHHKHLTLGAVQLLIIVRDEMLLAQSMAVEQQRSNIGRGAGGYVMTRCELWRVTRSRG